MGHVNTNGLARSRELKGCIVTVVTVLRNSFLSDDYVTDSSIQHARGIVMWKLLRKGYLFEIWLPRPFTKWFYLHFRMNKVKRFASYTGLVGSLFVVRQTHHRS